MLRASGRIPLCSRCSRSSLNPIGSTSLRGNHRLALPLRAKVPSAAPPFFFPNRLWSDAAPHASIPIAEQVTAPPQNGPTQSLSIPVVPYPPLDQALETYKPVPSLTLTRILGIYSQLSKTRLTTLVVLSSMSAVALCPLPTTMTVLLATAAGTSLCSAAANTINQLSEVPYDAQMARTRSRPLVRRAISPLHATGFAIATATAGPTILWTFVNPTTAILGAFNIFLYAGVYTPLKRRSVVNTWVGAVVGAIPPLMGWTACGGHLLPSALSPIQLFPPPFLEPFPDVSSLFPDNPLAPLALFLVLFSWQFPHFNSLSHLIRSSYAVAGYRMLAVTAPRKNALVSLRHSLFLIPICSILAPLSGMTTWAFAITGFIPNAVLARSAWRFWRTGTDKDARKLWHNSLWYLPVVLGLMMFHKRGVEWGQWFKDTNEGEISARNDSG